MSHCSVLKFIELVFVITIVVMQYVADFSSYVGILSYV